MFDSYNRNNLSEYEQVIRIEICVLEYLATFNCVQTIVILVCKQISSNLFRNKKLLTYKSYAWPFNWPLACLNMLSTNYLTVWKKLSSDLFKDII